MTRLIHVTDLHFWKVTWNPLRLLGKRALGNFNVWLRRRHEFHMHNANDAADYIAKLGAQDVFLGGDFTSTALPEEFEMAAKWMERLERHHLNLHVVPGNHDVYTFESARLRRFERVMQRHMPEDGFPTVRKHHFLARAYLLVRC
jgi:3',5'-cyclic AMP phosphodiesterase CpdA